MGRSRSMDSAAAADYQVEVQQHFEEDNQHQMHGSISAAAINEELPLTSSAPVSNESMSRNSRDVSCQTPRLCHFYSRHGECTKGTNCTFQHSDHGVPKRKKSSRQRRKIHD